MFYHAYPWVMDFDPHSGDYGLGFFGNALILLAILTPNQAALIFCQLLSLLRLLFFNSPARCHNSRELVLQSLRTID